MQWIENRLLPEEPKLPLIGSFAEFRKEGFTPFSLGPLYTYVGVRESIIDAFLNENIPKRPPDTRGGRLLFQRPVLVRCEHWNYILEIMDSPSFGFFKTWLCINHFVRRAEQKFFLARHYPSPMLDPLLLDMKGEKKPEVLDVFTVSGTKALLRPVCEISYDQAQPFIDFTRMPPEPETIQLAQATLGVL